MSGRSTAFGPKSFIGQFKVGIPVDIEKMFTSGGVIERNLRSFELRPQQIEMSLSVQKALAESRHLVIEAGTGVGKSFGYIVPVVKTVCEEKCRILISTFTITLQEQLTNKDIPFLAECFDSSFTAVLAKGRGNYLCKRRLEYAIRRGRLLFDESAHQLAMINDWAQQTQDGSLSDMPFVPQAKVWDAVNSEHGNCKGRSCGHFGNCFYLRARSRLEKADIIIANHALMFSDLVLKEQGASVLPNYKYVIIDEAHNIERVAEDHFGINISNYKIKLLLDTIYNPVTKRGILAYIKSDDIVELVIQIAKDAKRFFKNAVNWYEADGRKSNGRCYKNFIDDNMSGHLKDLRTRISQLANETKDVDEQFELVRLANRCGLLVQDMESFLMQKKSDYVYWVEAGKRKRATVYLRAAAINVGDDMNRCLFEKYDSVVMTSATLSVDSSQRQGFDFFAKQVGLKDFDAVKVGSPFDYEKQVTVYIEKDLPNPNDAAFISAATEAVKKYTIKTGGKTFVLFTSYSMLDAMAEEIADCLKDNQIELLQQGTGFDRSVLLERFKKDQRSVLFGTDSFWQGVDVPGEALSNVIIVRLPFAVPNHPLLAGRLEQIRNEGGDPFADYQLPCAIIKFKQGFGRLIRSRTDKGIVVVLDSRIANKSYGRRFLSAIPKCKVEIVGSC